MCRASNVSACALARPAASQPTVFSNTSIVLSMCLASFPPALRKIYTRCNSPPLTSKTLHIRVETASESGNLFISMQGFEDSSFASDAQERQYITFTYPTGVPRYDYNYSSLAGAVPAQDSGFGNQNTVPVAPGSYMMHSTVYRTSSGAPQLNQAMTAMTPPCLVNTSWTSGVHDHRSTFALQPTAEPIAGYYGSLHGSYTYDDSMFHSMENTLRYGAGNHHQVAANLNVQCGTFDSLQQEHMGVQGDSHFADVDDDAVHEVHPDETGDNYELVSRQGFGRDHKVSEPWSRTLFSRLYFRSSCVV
ncbi:hypothetical protein F5I97DRAFT_624809 [Phlebopus sp. FC_14]|nr:hypothetical protein F5I97DRAFT_624809 [Phlebopus sp. FC_14]